MSIEPAKCEGSVPLGIYAYVQQWTSFCCYYDDLGNITQEIVNLYFSLIINIFGDLWGILGVKVTTVMCCR